MKNNYLTWCIRMPLLQLLIFSTMTCLAQNPAGVVSHIAEHTDPSRTKRIDSKQHDILYHEQIKPWSRHEVVTDTSIRVYFQVSDACKEHRAVLQETDDTIDIIVISGFPHIDEEGEGYVCRPVAMLGPGEASFLLHTQQPIGTRKITQINSPPVELRKRPIPQK